MNHDLARTEDPTTSHLAAASIDLNWTDKLDQIFQALPAICPATDLEMAEALSSLGFGKEESCRRSIRTLREKYGRLVPARDVDGSHLRHLNSTGRWADCWIPGEGYVAPPAPATVQCPTCSGTGTVEHPRPLIEVLEGQIEMFDV